MDRRFRRLEEAVPFIGARTAHNSRPILSLNARRRSAIREMLSGSDLIRMGVKHIATGFLRFLRP